MSGPGEPAGAPAPFGGNELSGTVHGPTVQAHQIHGDIYYCPPSRSETGHEVIPAEVPALTFRFVNRRAALRELDDWFEPADDEAAAESPPVGLGVLGGLPGVGKSATARHWARRAKQRFPDGQIYVDFATLRAEHGPGADLSEAVAQALRSLGVGEEGLPNDLGSRTNLFRSRSAGRRLLVLLEDVAQPAQVRALLPQGTGSVLLATSNRRLDELVDADGARRLELEPLDTAGALHLLADRCGERTVAADRRAAERLVELCGRLPVALAVVAARLLTTRGLTLPALVAELEDEAHRLTGMTLRGERTVAAVFGVVYRELPSEAARCYRHLVWLPSHTFDLGVAAVAADRTPEALQKPLGALEEAGLLERTGDGRFRMHDLVRLHARECAAEAEPEAEVGVVARTATHYLALTALADRAIRPDRLRVADLTALLDGADDPFAASSGPAPLDWLAAERANLLAVLRAAARHGLHARVWPLAEALTVLFLHHRHLRDWRESLELGVAAAVAAVEPAAEARLRSLLSRPLMDLEEYDAARDQLTAAVACAEVAGNAVLAASVQEFFGRYWDHVDGARALAAYQRSVELNREAGEYRGVAIARFLLGRAQLAAGDDAAALASLREAHRDLLARADRRMAARARAALGEVHAHRGETEEARRALRAAAEALGAVDASHYEAQARERLADLVAESGGPAEEVRTELTRAWEIHRTGGNPRAEAVRRRLDSWGGPFDPDAPVDGDAPGPGAGG